MAVLVQAKGVAAVLPPVGEVLDRGDEVPWTEVKLPRRMACRVMIEKKTSAMSSYDPGGGVKPDFYQLVRTAWSSDSGEDFAKVGR